MNTLYLYVKQGDYWVNTLEQVMFADFSRLGNKVTIVEEDMSDKLAIFLARRKVTKLTFGLLSGFLGKRYRLGQTLNRLSPEYDRIIVLFLNTSVATVRYPAEVLRKYKERWPNIQYVLFYIDPLSRGAAIYANYLRERSAFDVVYSFDQLDARENGLLFWRTPYSVIPELQEIQPNKDLYFTGVSGGRYSLLHEISVTGTQQGANIEMDVVLLPPDKDFSQSTPTFRLHQPSDLTPYRTVLEKTLEARCILDVVRPNQTGLSLRAYEAVVYNRKLLTNNPSILTFPFYDPRYMRCFRTVDDIDWDWVKEDIPVDYHYSGEFSPVNLLRDAENRFWGSDDGTGSASQ